MLKELSIQEFVREVSSPSPAPGGGSVAALAGAQAAALLSMYCNLSQNRNKLGEIVDMLQNVGEEARFLMTRMLEAVDENTVAFNQVMESYRMPKESEKEKAEREKAVQEALKNAADVPVQTARGSLRVLSLVNEAAGKGNPSAISDLGVANLQALAALTGACYNVKMNLDMLSDEQLVEDFAHEVDELVKQGWKLFDESRLVIEM